MVNQFSIMPLKTLKISLGFLVSVICGYKLNLFYSGVCGAMTDVVNYFVKPMGAYFWGFTLSATLSHVIYSLFFYKKVPSLLRCVCAHVIVTVFVNLCLNTIWIHILCHQPLSALFSQRLLKELIFLIFQPFVSFKLIKMVSKLKYKDINESK